MRFKRILALGMTMIVFATGCQKAPEDAAVKEKNLDKMIEQAKEGSDEPESIAEKYDIYKKEFSNEKLGVKVKANAKVEIPKTEKMSIVRVKQKKITQEFLDKVKSALNLNQIFYDGCVTQIETKLDIEKLIGGAKAGLAELARDDNYEQMKEEHENYIKELEEKYKNAPKTVDWNKYLSDGKIESVKNMRDKYDKDKSNDFYDWEYDLNKKGEVYYGVTGGDETDSVGLFVQNNEDRGNCLRFFKSKNIKKPSVCAAIVGVNNGNAIDTNSGMWTADRKPTNEDVDFSLEDGGKIQFYEYKNEPTTISQSHAMQMAAKFLEKIGLTDYEYNNGGLYCETFGFDNEEGGDNRAGYRKVWYLHYLRNLGGVLVNNDSGFKYQDGWKGKDFVKKEWSGESIDICINDSGIVTFNYNVPIEITETVVENAKLKNYKNIQKNFEKMATTVYAQNQDEEKNEVTINIDKVVLRYMRISEKDSFDTGLLVPVWDFIGTIKDKFGLYGQLKHDSDGTKEQSILTLNAIDGTVIDKNLGY